MTAVTATSHDSIATDQILHTSGDPLDFQHPTILTQIFQKWQIPNHLPYTNVRQNHPLSLFCQAEHRLASAIKLLETIQEMEPVQFRRFTNQVHQYQTELLNAIYHVYCEMDSVLKCSRGYRRFLRSEDREELNQGFSETILFAAQALSRGFQIRGIENYTEELRGPAQRLCATFEALRYVFHSRVVEYPVTISLVRLFPVLMDFDQAWVEFERVICYTYFNINGRRAREKEREEMQEWSLWVDLMCGTLKGIIENNLLSSNLVKECDPTVFFALPRMSLLSLLRSQRNSVTKLNILSSHTSGLFQIAKELDCLTAVELYLLQTWLCGGEVNPTLINIHQVFTKICTIVDPLQSGGKAKFFLSVMSKVLKRYIKESSD